MGRPVVNPGKIDWTGENPSIQLKLSDDGPYSCMASLFRVVHSPFGYGHAAFILPAPTQEGAPNACYTDNRPLAKWLASEFVAYFGPFKGLPALRGLSFVDSASFAFTAKSPDIWEEKITSENRVVLLRWLRLGESFLVELPRDQSPTGKHEMFSLFVPAETGEVLINDELMPGRPVMRQIGNKGFRSSFLAFSETWIRHE